ncbi:inorganic diphosphatase, partial [Staphylococcus aureus]|nr:inorganic diphosphatase [Staphylococcus aureus]
MNLDRIPAGKDLPNDFNVVIEISANAAPIKFEFDKESNALFVDRFMGTSMMYPANYGFVPQTLSDDGDPVDVLVVTPFVLQP